MVTAPVTNKKVMNAPIQVRLSDATSIKSSHTCNLDLPHLPAAARKAHFIPGVATISLLSVGQLVDSNCVVFDKVKVAVLHNHSKVLEVQRNLKMDGGQWNCNKNQTSRSQTMNSRFLKSQIQLVNSQTPRSQTMNFRFLKSQIQI
jgi:hypothetical protein